jgi:glycosyltransferase involved in cell wall biosynthesis
MLRLAAAQDPRVRVTTRPNTGIVGALNDGLRMCRGEYIARMDADDTCVADRLAKQVAYLDEHPKCLAVGTWLWRTDPQGNPAGTQEPPVHHEQIDRVLITGNASSIVHASAMIRRKALQEIDGWTPGRDGVEDLDLFLRLAERGELANIPEALYVYRRHFGSICANNFEKMVKGGEEVVAEAWKRRGLPGEPDLTEFRLRVAAVWRPADFFRCWACHALKAGNKRAARRHAWSGLWREPLKLRSWRVVWWAVRG